MHRKGINMRYLGMLAELVEVEGPKMDYGTVTKVDSELALNALKVCLSDSVLCILPDFSAMTTANAPARDGLALRQAHP